MARNPLLSEAPSGELDLILVRVTRSKSGGPLLMLPGTETVLTVVSGRDNLESYIREEYATSPCRIWIAMLGDIAEGNFKEISVRPVLDLKP